MSSYYVPFPFNSSELDTLTFVKDDLYEPG